MDRFPDGLIAFQRMFPDDDACAAWLASARRRRGSHAAAAATVRLGHYAAWRTPSNSRAAIARPRCRRGPSCMAASWRSPSASGPPMWCYPESIGCPPTPRDGRVASTTACCPNTRKAISRSSSSASTAAPRAMPPSAPCSTSSPHQIRYIQNLETTGAICISGSAYSIFSDCGRSNNVLGHERSSHRFSGVFQTRISRKHTGNTGSWTDRARRTFCNRWNGKKGRGHPTSQPSFSQLLVKES